MTPLPPQSPLTRRPVPLRERNDEHYFFPRLRPSRTPREWVPRESYDPANDRGEPESLWAQLRRAWG